MCKVLSYAVGTSLLLPHLVLVKGFCFLFLQVVNGIVSLISVLALLSLVHRKAPDLC